MGDGESGSASDDGKGNVKVRMKQSDFDKLQKEWQDTMVSAAAAQHEHEQRESTAAGCIPSGIQRMIDDLSKPRVNWRQALKRFVIAVSSRAYSFARPNKALFSQGWTLPGFRTRVNELDIVIMVDTSGSIGRDQLTAFVSEMKGIMNSFQRYKIQAWCFDGDVILESAVTLEKHTRGGDSWDQIIKFAERIGGGGGTVFSANWDYMKKERIKPRLVLMLTDGMPCGSWGDPMYCPTMFMIMGNTSAQAPFGLTIHYEDPDAVKRAA
jgi:predicted metal-dependent peptidase